HRLRRPAGHRADDPPEAAGRVSAQRVPPRKRNGRPDRRSPRDESRDRASAAVHGRKAGGAGAGPRDVRGAPARVGAAALSVEKHSTTADMSSPSASLDYLFGLDQFGIKFGLENIAAIVERLGHPERAYRTVHIAG